MLVSGRVYGIHTNKLGSCPDLNKHSSPTNQRVRDLCLNSAVRGSGAILSSSIARLRGSSALATNDSIFCTHWIPARLPVSWLDWVTHQF